MTLQYYEVNFLEKVSFSADLIFLLSPCNVTPAETFGKWITDLFIIYI